MHGLQEQCKNRCVVFGSAGECLPVVGTAELRWGAQPASLTKQAVKLAGYAFRDVATFGLYLPHHDQNDHDDDDNADGAGRRITP
jgi:hypothetical protein